MSTDHHFWLIGRRLTAAACAHRKKNPGLNHVAWRVTLAPPHVSRSTKSS